MAHLRVDLWVLARCWGWPTLMCAFGPKSILRLVCSVRRRSHARSTLRHVCVMTTLRYAFVSPEFKRNMHCPKAKKHVGAPAVVSPPCPRLPDPHARWCPRRGARPDPGVGAPAVVPPPDLYVKSYFCEPTLEARLDFPWESCWNGVMLPWACFVS
jgi:hypothetical protein